MSITVNRTNDSFFHEMIIHNYSKRSEMSIRNDNRRNEMTNYIRRNGCKIATVKTPWGQWWQTSSDVFIEVDIPPDTQRRHCRFTIKPDYIECCVRGQVIFSGTLYKTVHANESMCIVEEKRISITLEKVENEKEWVSLLQLYPLDQHEMFEKLYSEKFQVEDLS